MDFEGLTRHVSEQTVVDLVAEAWRVLSNPDDSDGKGNINSADVGYFDDDWSKHARRLLRGFAETNERPAHWPWTDRRFDGFPWQGPHQ